MKKILVLFLLIVFVGCSEDDNNNSDDTPSLDFSVKEIDVTVVLPEDSNLNLEDLRVSSIFTLNRELVNGSAKVDVFDNDALELIFVTNMSGDLVMMKYINPIEQLSIQIDNKTTAQGLILLHPWVIHLSAQARFEALQEIILLPEYPAFEASINQAISSETLDPLASESIVDAVSNMLNSVLNRNEQEPSPLLMKAENDKVEITNLKSSMAYSLQLFDENENLIGDEELVKGINKELLSWSNVVNFLSGNFDVFQPTKVTFPVPNENQKYTLKAESWEGEAAVRNSLTLFKGIIGIVSTTLKEVLDNAECFIDTSNVFVGLGTTTVQALLDGQNTTPSDMIRQLITAVLDNGSSIKSAVVSCTDIELNFGESFEKLLKNLSYAKNFESGAILLLNAIDIADYASEIEFCFQNTDEGQVECNGIFGTWTITAPDSCDETDEFYTGPFTLNSDFTVTQEDDSNGNYITNFFTFENNVLSISIEYMDPVCDGTEFIFQRDTATLTYDSATDSFSGTGTTTKEGIDVPGCFRTASSCNYNITLTR